MGKRTALNDLKWNYNYNLNRFYNGCEYIANHLEEHDKYEPEIQRILNNINLLLEEIMKYEEVDSNTVLYGFKEI